MKKYYYCVDVGGTSIKAGIVDKDNNIIHKGFVKTIVSSHPDFLSESILKLIASLEEKSNLPISKAAGLGIGVPGLIDSENGLIRYSGNLKLKNYPLKQTLESKLNIPIKVSNDASVALLAELFAGAGRNYKNFIMLTLGTGIGGGIVIGGRPLSEFSNFCCEVGHMKVTSKKLSCTCGDYGCFEALASTKALTTLTASAMKKNPDSLMWQSCTPETASGKTVFEFLDKDKTAQDVFNEYIENLGTGIVSLYNIFNPEAIIIGGAISQKKHILIDPLKKYVDSRIFVQNADIKSNIIIAEMTGDAGIVGGKFLFRKEKKWN